MPSFDKKVFFCSLIASSLIFLGAACGTEQNQNNQREVSKVEEQIKKDIEKATEKNKDKDKKHELSLEAEPRGEGKVHFEWKLRDEKEVDRFVIVRDENKNPVHNGKNYWFRQPGSRRSITWINIPSGTYHFRICILENNECTEYSNDVKVKVK
ncbi:MAG: hypothetical protein ABEJ24_01320 [Candidatus Magasanikbacteria bacterium]